MDCKITSGVPCIQVGSDELGKAITGQTDYVATYDSVNFKYIITFTMTDAWTGNLGALVGNYGTGNTSETEYPVINNLTKHRPYRNNYGTRFRSVYYNRGGGRR